MRNLVQEVPEEYERENDVRETASRTRRSGWNAAAWIVYEQDAENKDNKRRICV
jgi:hypothetical protein